MEWIWIKGPWFTASVDVKNGYVVRGAPITKWMWGKTTEEIMKLNNKKGWDVRPMP